MWKVIIADDEPIIREGIRDAVNWEALQMQVVAEAEDGEEALEQAIGHSVHVMLVDLNMPIMDGLTLIRHVRERLPDCKIIIITGHDEFSYAQEAIRLHVDDYILKPANPAQLKGVLEGIQRGLEANVEQDAYLKMASTQIERNFHVLREQFYVSWINGEMNEAEILEQLRFLQLPAEVPKQLGIIQCPEFYANQPLMKEQDRRLLLFAIQNIVIELLGPIRHIVFCDYGGLVVVGAWTEIPVAILQRIQEVLKQYVRITVNLHVESVQGGVAGVAGAYRRCKRVLYQDIHISPMVRRARQYMETHFADPDITLESLAQQLQVSSVYLSKMIKQELGTPFVGLLTNMRMKKAIELLNGTDLPILEIAESVGYETQHYFSTAFKKAVGVSPKQYRKEAALPQELRRG